MSAGMGLKDIVGSGDGPYGAGVEQIRSAWMSEDFDAATEGWDRWLRPQLNALARERDER